MRAIVFSTYHQHLTRHVSSCSLFVRFLFICGCVLLFCNSALFPELRWNDTIPGRNCTVIDKIHLYLKWVARRRALLLPSSSPRRWQSLRRPTTRAASRRRAAHLPSSCRMRRIPCAWEGRTIADAPLTLSSLSVDRLVRVVGLT